MAEDKISEANTKSINVSTRQQQILIKTDKPKNFRFVRIS